MKSILSKSLLTNCIFSLLLIGIFSSCSKSGPSEAAPSASTPSVVVKSLSVTTGPYNTEVIITGTGFSSSKNNKVFFNGKTASISFATTTQLTVNVPLGAGTGAVTVSVDNGTPATGPVFTYQVAQVVTTFAGTGSFGTADGTGTQASFKNPWGIALDKAGNLYVTDSFNNLIRKITPAGIVSTVAGSGTTGAANGTGAQASFNFPTGITVDDSGNLYVADTQNNLIRKITSAGVVTTLAGSGNMASNNGTGTAASFFYPNGITIDNSGNLYVADTQNNLIRKITQAGVVTTLAGNSNIGNADGTGTTASFAKPAGITFDNVSGNLYVADTDNKLIRTVTLSGMVSKYISCGQNTVKSLVVDKSGNIYFTNFNEAGSIGLISNNIVSNFSGLSSPNLPVSPVNGLLTLASYNDPVGIAIDSAGNIYVADGYNIIRKITYL